MFLDIFHILDIINIIFDLRWPMVENDVEKVSNVEKNISEKQYKMLGPNSLLLHAVNPTSGTYRVRQQNLTLKILPVKKHSKNGFKTRK